MKDRLIGRQSTKIGLGDPAWNRIVQDGTEIDVGTVERAIPGWEETSETFRAVYPAGLIIPPRYELVMKTWTRRLLFKDLRSGKLYQRPETVVLYDIKPPALYS
jgi:hypothetical protein